MINFNTDIDEDDFEAWQALQAEVRKALIAYTGKFDFMLEMQAHARGGEYIFTRRQIAAIQRCFEKDAYRQAAIPAPADDPAAFRLPADFPRGTRYYAVDGEKQTAFFRVDYVEKGNWADWMFIRILAGPEEIKCGSQKPGGVYKGTQTSLLAKIVENPIEAMKRYGREIGQCGFCAKRLTDELSREIGIGPVCRGKIGI